MNTINMGIGKMLDVCKNIAQDETISLVEKMCDKYACGEDISEYTAEVLDIASKLIEFGEERGINGNLWTAYLTDIIVNSENAYSTTFECGGNGNPIVGDSIVKHVLWDMELINSLYHLDVKGVFNALELSAFDNILDYHELGSSRVYNSRIRDRICELNDKMSVLDDPQKMLDELTDFYKTYGVGKLGLHKAFRIVENDKGSVDIIPILKIAHVSLSDLVGYEIPKGKLIANTDAFVNRRPSNNCLLYGDAGTGKSSCIKAITNEYYEKGLRVIEVYRHQFRYLNDLIAQIKDRNYRFIIYMDDLSFEDFETEYKYLKAVIEGGLERKPGNVLIYATSNRRHLIKETVSDRDDRDPDMHRSDTMAEKLSLSGRFGESIFFGSPDKKQFDQIVEERAKRHDINITKEELLLEANKWELSHGGRSGRTAQQFIDHLLGQPERE